MPGKAVISLTTGLEDPEKVTVAFLVAVGAAESGRPTMMFLTKEAVRLALDGFATGVACDGCPPLADLLKRYETAGGRYYVCPLCFNAKKLSPQSLIAGAEIEGTIPLWAWIGDEGATTFSYLSLAEMLPAGGEPSHTVLRHLWLTQGQARALAAELEDLAHRPHPADAGSGEAYGLLLSLYRADTPRLPPAE